ncbi:hypothetical protein MBLNU459_g7240t2 [Dothideomycetes sp. NU459]
MVLSTLGVAADVTPSVIETFFSHSGQYLNRKPLHNKPTAHISYHEGLRLIRKFLNYASQHTVEDIQAFTGQWVPSPTWVKLEEFTIPDAHLARSATLIQAQLGHRGLDKVGGKTWWQWRRPEIPLKAEWIEMRQDYNDRKAAGHDAERIILYVHGGAYYFGSVDEHRYQMQRHARKLKAQCLAPRYRLAPQFPFPCGLHDCIAAYLYLIQNHHPSTVLLAGDSAGGGMVISMLVTLRDQGIPLPAGAILLSPWVDLTHSFPSVAGEGKLDYIPPNGFHHKPSMAWPPPNAVDMKDISMGAVESLVDKEKKTHHKHIKDPALKEHERKEELDEQEAVRGFSISQDVDNRDEVKNPHNPATPERPDRRKGDTIPGPGAELSIELDGVLVELHDQIQMYASNHLLAHPLVSPALQPSLGGLPPLLIQTGGGELLRDEQIYLAHKAANPAAYPPGDNILDEYDPHREILNKYPPTNVQLQVWDDLCHVPHTLSFTRPAKYMYRSVAQFGAWALAHAQKKAITILDDDAISVISTDSGNQASDSSTPPISDPGSEQPSRGRTVESASEIASGQTVGATQIRAHTFATSSGSVGKAGDPLPPFVDYMIRQRVDRHGMTYPLAAASDIPSLHIDPNIIGVIKPGPVRKWLAKKKEWDVKYGKEKRSVQKRRIKEMAAGYDTFGNDEVPPPTALAGRRGTDMPAQTKRHGKSWGLAMWSGWGSKHDQTTIEREHKINRKASEAVALPEAGQGIPGALNTDDTASVDEKVQKSFERSRSPSYRAVTDQGQASILGASAGAGAVGATGAVVGAEARKKKAESKDLDPASIDTTTKVPGSENTFLSPNSARPHNGQVAYPFKLRNQVATASTMTLDSTARVPPMDGINDGDSVSSGAEVERAENMHRDGAEIGGHEWVIGSATAGGGTHARDVENGSVSSPAPGSDPAAIATTRDREAGATDGAADDGGNEIGSRNWVLGTSSDSKPASSTANGNGHENGSSTASAAPGPQYGTNVESGHIRGAADAERPKMQTFVTARESL